MLSDANIPAQTLNKKQLDLIYVAETKHLQNMSFATFLSVLPKIALHKFPNQQPQEALHSLVENHFNPLFESIIGETNLGPDLALLQQPIDPITFKILLNVTPILFKIYTVLDYFPGH